MKLEDIARLSNVSKSAASLAINGKPGVSDKTRARILSIAKENNYTPLRIHVKKEDKNEKILKIRFVACINADIVPENYEQLPFFKELLSSLSTEIGHKVYSLATNAYSKDDLLAELVKTEAATPSDGILLLGTNLTHKQINEVNNEFSNLVVLDNHCSNINCNTVTMNNYLGAYSAAQHLIDMGHKKIGYIKGTPRINNFYNRREGFKDALIYNNINISNVPLFHLPGMKISLISKHHQPFINFVSKCTAIFCEDDYIAISVIKTLNNFNISVPTDISVIGFDDISESQVIYPELSTIHVPIKEMIFEAINLIEMGIDITSVKKQMYINTSLISRDSVKMIRQ